MLISGDLLKRTIVITLGLVLEKLFLFFLPYFLTSGTYNEFNKNYYLAGLISSFAVFGFNFSVKFVKLRTSLIFALVIVNCLIVASILWLFFEKGAFSPFALFYGVISIMLSILQFEFLFTGKLKEYASAVMIIFTASVISLVGSIALGLDLFLLLTIFNAVSLVIILSFSEKKELTGMPNVLNFYKVGLSAFIINGVAVVVLATGKYLSTNLFEETAANSYIFASLLITPLFFAGNILERVIYTLKKKLFNSKLLIMGLSFLFYISISAGIVALWLIFPQLLPKSIDGGTLIRILIFMLLGTSIFSSLHFPLNGILFKESKTETQKQAAIYNFILILIFGLGLYLLYKMDFLSDVVLVVYSYACMILFALTKYRVMVRAESQSPEQA